MEITYNRFKSVFSECEKIPKDKEGFMKKLYQFYQYGRKNKEDEVKNKFNKLIKDILT